MMGFISPVSLSFRVELDHLFLSEVHACHCIHCVVVTICHNIDAVKAHFWPMMTQQYRSVNTGTVSNSSPPKLEKTEYFECVWTYKMQTSILL